MVAGLHAGSFETGLLRKEAPAGQSCCHTQVSLASAGRGNVPLVLVFCKPSGVLLRLDADFACI